MTTKCWKFQNFRFNLKRTYLCSKEGRTGRLISRFYCKYFFPMSQSKKLIIHWEAQLISSFVLLQVEVHNFKPRCWKIQNSRVSSGPDGFSGPAFIMVFFGIACMRPSCDNSTCYVTDSARGQDEAIPECWLAGRVDIIGPLCPLGICHFNPAQEKNWELVQFSN